MRGNRPIVARLVTIFSIAVLTLASIAAAGGGPTSPQLADAARPPSSPALTPEQLIAMADEVTKEVEALRGWSFKRPITKELTTVAQTREYLQRQAAKEIPAGRLPLEQALLRTVGLIPQSLDLKSTWLVLLESQVGGFYDPDAKTMHLVVRPDLPPFFQRITLAHELTHALDDQYVDLQSVEKSREAATEDMDLASESVVEGSATALMMQYAARLMMSGRMDPAALQQYAREETDRNKSFLDAPRYFSAMVGAYICGTQFLARGSLMTLILAPDDKAIGEALVAARKDPPQSTEQILHPDKYWDPARRDAPVVIDDKAAAAWLARPGRSIVYADTLGEMLTSILTSPGGSTTSLAAFQSADGWTNTAAAGWGGDRFYLVADGATPEAARTGLKNLAGAWMTAWDTPKDREEFLAALPAGSLAAGAAGYPVGDVAAVVFFGLDEGERSRLIARLRESPLPMRKDGRAWPPNQ